MEKYTLEEVKTRRQAREFLSMARKLYKGNRNWVQPLDDDIEKVFDPARNRMFEGGEAIRWLLRNGQGDVVGRIAAFYNADQAAAEEQPTGGCGFFECINSQEAANMLFDAARDGRPDQLRSPRRVVGLSGAGLRTAAALHQSLQPSLL